MAGQEVRTQSGDGIVSAGPDTEANAAADQRRRDARAQSTAGRNLGGMERKGKTPPKAADYSGDMAAFGTAMRKYRESMNSDPEMTARQRALSK